VIAYRVRTFSDVRINETRDLRCRRDEYTSVGDAN